MNDIIGPIAAFAILILIARYIIVMVKIVDMVEMIVTDAQSLNVSKLGALGTKYKFSEDTIVLCLQLARANCLSKKLLERRKTFLERSKKETIIEALLKDYVVEVKKIKNVNGYIGKPVDRKIKFLQIIKLSSTFDRMIACIGATASLVALILEVF